MKDIKTIALVEWHWVGHHPTYFAHYILALEELGMQVLAICPNPEEAQQTVAKLRQQRNGEASHAGQTVYRQVSAKGFRFLRVRPARISAIDWAIRHFGSIEGMIKKWQTESGKQVDLVFYACIYDPEFNWIKLVQRFLTLPWAGLYLHAFSLRSPETIITATGRPAAPERIFRNRLCKGIAILDEGMASRFAELMGKPVVVFPDLTDERLPAVADGPILANHLKRFAGGRPIVGLFGYLQKSKGVKALALVSQAPQMSEVCFAVGGEKFWGHFAPNEAKEVDELLYMGPNIWHHFRRIQEQQLNSLLSVCDIVYAAYENFPHSSNLLTKAALFRKPLIVSDGYLMAERVRRFKLGEVVPQGNVGAVIAAITKITRDPKAWQAENQPRWSDYCLEHSFGRLKSAFRDLFSSL